jgi:WD40 repeat protein
MKIGRKFVWNAANALVGVAFVTSGRLAAEEPDFPRDQFLARGHFHSAVFDKEGRRLLTASGSTAEGSTPIAQLWDAETGRLIREFDGHLATIHSISFSPDGRQILTGAGNNFTEGGQEDPTVRVWDVATGKQLAVLNAKTTYVMSSQFSPDGTRILALCDSLTGFPGDTATVWDAASYEKRLVISDVATFCKAMQITGTIQFSPSGNTIAGMTSNGYRIRLWDVKTGEVLWQVDGKEYGQDEDDRIGFGAPEFSPDGKTLLTVCSDNKARIWDAKNGWKARAFTCRGSRIRAAAFCYGGSHVMTAGDDGTAQFWDNVSGEEVRRFEHPGPVMEITIAGDSSRMVTKWSKNPPDDPSGDKIRWFASLWDVTDGREVRRLELGNNPSGVIMFSPNSEKLFTSRGTGNVAMLDAKTGKVIRAYK